MMTVRTLVPTLDRVLSLNHELDRVLAGSVNNASTWLPSMDVVERADAFVVTLDVPGVSHDAIDLTFDRGTLTIRGTRSGAEHGDQDRIYVAERALGEFERDVRLPETVDGDRIQASVEAGVVTIMIPKAPAARARKIAISATGHQN